MKALLDECEARGMWKLVSRIFPENGSSLALCGELGFREVGTYRRHARLDGEWRDCVIVELLLGSTTVDAQPRDTSRRRSREPAVGRHVKASAKPGRGRELAAKLLDVADRLRDAPGCDLYLISRSSTDPDVVYVVEQWESEAFPTPRSSAQTRPRSQEYSRSSGTAASSASTSSRWVASATEPTRRVRDASARTPLRAGAEGPSF